MLWKAYFFFDYVTKCGDVSSSAVYSCDSQVGNIFWEQLILSRFDNFKSIQMLKLFDTQTSSKRVLQNHKCN